MSTLQKDSWYISEENLDKCDEFTWGATSSLFHLNETVVVSDDVALLKNLPYFLIALQKKRVKIVNVNSI